MHDLPPEGAAILARYDIGQVLDVTPLRGGMFLRPLLLTTTSGRYVLRAHAFRATAARFRFQAETLEAAAERGVRCPRVLRNCRGRWGERRGAAFWALHEYLPGACPSWPEWRRRKAEPGFLRQLGARVARLHDTLRELAPGGDPGLSPGLPPIQFGHLARVRHSWNAGMAALAAADGLPAHRSRAALLELQSRVESHWQALSDAVERLGIGRMSRQTVHGDLSPVNLVFEDNDGFGLIDWDCVHVGLRMYDALGDILLRPPWDEPEHHTLDLREVREYVEGYAGETALSLSRQETAAVPALCLARQLEDLRQRLAVLPGLAAEQDEEYATLIRMRVGLMDDLAPYVRPRDGELTWL